MNRHLLATSTRALVALVVLALVSTACASSDTTASTGDEQTATAQASEDTTDASTDAVTEGEEDNTTATTEAAQPEDAVGPPDGAGPPPGGGPPGGGPGQDVAAQADPLDVSEVDADELAERTEVALAAGWADNVELEVDGTTLTFSSDGLPAHEYLDTYLGDGPDGKFVAGGVNAYDATYSFPLVPTVADAPSETGNGAIGVAISGAVFFDPYEGDGSDTVANDDNETIDGIPFIDACGGHPLPTETQYHYHGIPFCITDAIDTPGEHSAIVGYLFDGHAIYGPQDVDGEEPTDLDACLGHTGPTPEFEEDTYPYHVTSTANYISECLVGTLR